MSVLLSSTRVPSSFDTNVRYSRCSLSFLDVLGVAFADKLFLTLTLPCSGYRCYSFPIELHPDQQCSDTVILGSNVYRECKKAIGEGFVLEAGFCYLFESGTYLVNNYESLLTYYPFVS